MESEQDGITLVSLRQLEITPSVDDSGKNEEVLAKARGWCKFLVPVMLPDGVGLLEECLCPVLRTVSTAAVTIIFVTDGMCAHLVPVFKYSSMCLRGGGTERTLSFHFRLLLLTLSSL